MQSGWIRLWKLWTGLLMVLLVLLISPATASAHAYVVTSNPTINESLQSPPKTVEIQFDENVHLVPDGLTVTDEDGHRVDLGNGRTLPSNGREIVCTLPQNLGKGVYTIHWQVISADGHTVEGTIPFGVQVDVKALHLGATEAGYVPGVPMVLDRTVFYISMMLVIGLTIFFEFLWPKKGPSPMRGGRRWIFFSAWIALCLSTAFSLPIQAALSWGVHGTQAFAGKYLLRTLNLTLFGYTWIIQLLLELIFPPIIAVLLSETARRRWFWVALPVFGVPIAKAYVGHAVVHGALSLSIVADVIHLYAASIWLGGIVGTVLLFTAHLREHEPDADAVKGVVRQFSMLAGISVFVLGLTGFYAAIVNIPTWYSLWYTTYGEVLLCKLALFFCMVGLAAYHWVRRVHLSMYSLRRMVVLELIAGILILGLTSVLTNVQTAEVAPGPVNASQTAAGYAVHLQITPNKAGDNEFLVTLRDGGGHPYTAQQVTLSFSSSVVAAGSDTVRLVDHGNGTYTTDGLYLTGGGRWNVDVHVLTANYEDVDAHFKVSVGQ